MLLHNNAYQSLPDQTETAPPLVPPRRLVAVDVADFLSREIAPREYVLTPVVPSQGLVMLYAARGVGKTQVALAMAYAIASGGPCLRWNAPEPRRVLYVDGEMPAKTMQERLAAIVAGSVNEPPSQDYLRIITPDLQSDPMPDLSSPAGQTAIDEHLADGFNVMVLDNLSTLCRAGKENEADSWGPVQEWLLGLRRRGISVIMVHHAGKGGNQRGTSRREDVLDTVIALRRPSDYQTSEGARFEVHLEKCRGVFGPEADPFEAQLETRDGKANWSSKNLVELTAGRVQEMHDDLKMTVREIAEELTISKSAVHRLLKNKAEKLQPNGAAHHG